ncbi:hypothetical protein O9993_01300 [Vibrio lentus]|nr:hypothetical protein [Vibrio lentus]
MNGLTQARSSRRARSKTPIIALSGESDNVNST